MIKSNCFIHFQAPTEAYSLPEKFTFPFYYEPHPLCLLAAQELQHHLQTQTDWTHNFGIDKAQKGLAIGKMFGVLVVKNQENELGYLAAFSGKLADANLHPNFVPPVFDMLTQGSFFKKEEAIISAINDQIESLEKSNKLQEAKAFLAAEKSLSEAQLAQSKSEIKRTKKIRKSIRHTAKKYLSPEQYPTLEKGLSHRSMSQFALSKSLSNYWKTRLAFAERKLAACINEIEQLKEERKQKSAALQNKLFDQYIFLNQAGETKSLLKIFANTIHEKPPAGAGECAAPKLFQYAFQNKLKLVAMAEFWWGDSPKSEIRKHAHFYPSCRGKCEPILAHMLAGIEMDENPMLKNPALGKVVEIIYEDEHLAVINKPAEFLSVPGKNIQDSVYERMKERYPDATGPLIVHRLDMSTSGIMLIAKTKEAHQFLQHQFIKRTIKKRYIALLGGIVSEDKGLIDLPLRVDLNDRPRQLVCYEHGKPAKTQWKVIERNNAQTKIHFFPITGRTHQLRVHASHHLGLNSPIVGDDLYGNRDKRLHLHAEYIQFLHPSTQQKMNFQVDPEF